MSQPHARDLRAQAGAVALPARAGGGASGRHARLAGIRRFWTRYRRNRVGVVGLGLVLFFAFVALAAPLLAPFDPLQVRTGPRFSLPTESNRLGTDDLGRDIFSGLVYGVRVSMMVGFLAVVISSCLGTAVGALAGYYGGLVDEVLMRFTEFFLIIPTLFLALVIVAMFGSGIWIIIAVIGLLGWPQIARVVRSLVLALRQTEFVEAARALGAGNLRIIAKEILPNAIPAIVVVSSLQIAGAILLEAGLSFLGLGDPSARSLGLMLNDSLALFRTAWWTAVFPGVAISLIVLGFNLTGDGLNDALNPRLEEG